MHEVAIAEGILAAVEKERARHNFSKVTLVEITCGMYNCVSEDSLAFCFDLLTRATYLEGTQLKIRRLPPKYLCRDCRQEYEPPGDSAVQCPDCSSTNTVPLINNELCVTRLEVD